MQVEHPAAKVLVELANLQAQLADVLFSVPRTAKFLAKTVCTGLRSGGRDNFCRDHRCRAVPVLHDILGSVYAAKAAGPAAKRNSFQTAVVKLSSNHGPWNRVDVYACKCCPLRLKRANDLVKNNIHPTAGCAPLQSDFGFSYCHVFSCLRLGRRLSRDIASPCASPSSTYRMLTVRECFRGCLGSLGRRESGAPQLEGGHAGAGSSASWLWKIWKHLQHPQDTLMNIAKTSLSSKFIGSESARGLRPAAL